MNRVLLAPIEACLTARAEGLQVRDALLVLTPGPNVLLAWLLREPSTTSVTEGALRTGEGPLNIDACRIRWGADAPSQEEWNLKGSTGRSGHFDQIGDTLRAAYAKGAVPVPSGRWPTNVIFVHDATCVKRGTTKVAGHKGYPNGPGGKSMQYTSSKRGQEVRPQAWAGHADADGKEDTPIWECSARCPVQMLDTMSGERPSTLAGRGVTGQVANPAKARPEAFFGLWVGGLSHVYGDTGGASRFYAQFATFPEALAWLGKLTTAAGVPPR